MSGDDICWCVVFGTLIGVFVFSVMWLELLMMSFCEHQWWVCVCGILCVDDVLYAGCYVSI